MRHAPIYLRGNVWWCRVVNPDGGRRLKISTGCRDKKAAELRWRELERESVTPADKASHKTALGDALDRHILERRSAGRAEGTIEMLTQKARQLSRVLDAELPLARLTAERVDHFVSTRLADGASRSTLHKELVTLRGALRLATRRGEFTRPLETVLPISFASDYVPRTRALSELECKKLLTALSVKWRPVAAFILATGATYPSEVQNATREDVDTEKWIVLLRGTKRQARWRHVPIVSFAQPWLELAMTGAAKSGPLFPIWTNVRRDLIQACERAGIATCTPNDLRRTIASLLRARGAEPSLLAKFLGHTSPAMAYRVYGQLSPEQLGSLLDERCTPAVPRQVEKRGQTGLSGRRRSSKTA